MVLTRLGATDNMTDVGLRPGPIAREAYELRRAFPTLLSEVTRTSPGRSGKIQIVVGVRHGSFFPPPPRGFDLEYTAQSFSVSE